MKRFTIGMLAGLITGLILATTTLTFAAPGAIKLIVNGQEIHTDVPPQLINGRVMVPARFVAEPLGAKVEWDGAGNAVVIISNNIQKSMAPQLDEWISLRQLSEQSVQVTMGGPDNTLSLRNNDSVISLSVPDIKEGNSLTIMASGTYTGLVTIMSYQNQTFIKLKQARLLGLVR